MKDKYRICIYVGDLSDKLKEYYLNNDIPASRMIRRAMEIAYAEKLDTEAKTVKKLQNIEKPQVKVEKALESRISVKKESESKEAIEETLKRSLLRSMG